MGCCRTSRKQQYNTKMGWAVTSVLESVLPSNHHKNFQFYFVFRVFLLNVLCLRPILRRLGDYVINSVLYYTIYVLCHNRQLILCLYPQFRCHFFGCWFASFLAENKEFGRRPLCILIEGKFNSFKHYWCFMLFFSLLQRVFLRRFLWRRRPIIFLFPTKAATCWND